MLIRLLRTSLGFSALAVLTACGGGSGGTDDQSAPAQLGAALPDAGDYIAITQKQISLAESVRTGSVTVVREGKASGASSVKYRFVAGAAVDGDDYHGTDGTLIWADGERGARTINFLVESDTASEMAEDFSIEIFDIEGPDVLGVNDKTSVFVTDTPCNGTIPAAVQFDTTLSLPCYKLGGNATVASNAQLNISAGTTIVAAANSSITFAGGATINSTGTATLPVTLKGEVNQPGVWGGVSLDSASALHRISHTRFSNATNAIDLKQGGFALADNNNFSNNAGAGIILPLTDAETIGSLNTFAATPHGVKLTGTNIDEQQLVNLPALATHYLLANGLVVKGTLVLAAGVDLRIAADVPVIVLSTGAINAVGTDEMPISITGLEPSPGFWNGIQYVSSTRGDNRFEHVTLSHGGGDPARAGNIIVDGLDTQISIQQCVITHSAGFGIQYDSGAFQVNLQAVTFGQNRLGEQSL